MHSRISLLVLVIDVVTCAQFRYLKEQHVIKHLNKHELEYVSELADPDYLLQILDHIAIPRVVGTKSHQKVQDYITQKLEDNGFTVQVDQFDEKTPIFGTLTFNNIIGVLNPNAERYLVLACHYDSKYFVDFDFIGATDSAVPCAMMLNLIKALKNNLAAVQDHEMSLMLLFLDGEEAFHTWSQTDSIYGARNLAKQFKQTVRKTNGGEEVSMLDRIDVMVLLDLLGTKNPTFNSYFQNTERLYLVLSNAEDELNKLGLLKNHKKKYFVEIAQGSFVEDDHVPFMQGGVPILHLIPSPFPTVWHKPSDNMQAIDMETVENLNQILRVFVAQYLHLPIFNAEFVDAGGLNVNSRIHEEF